jgi:hypothetical protein
VEDRDRRTRWAGRASAAPMVSGEVRDGAGPTRPTPPRRPLTTTPAQARPRGQEAPEPSVPWARRPPRPARWAGAGLAGRARPWGKRGPRGPWPRSGRVPWRGGLLSGARGRPARRARQAAAGAAGGASHASRPTTAAGRSDRARSRGPARGHAGARAARRGQRPRPVRWRAAHAVKRVTAPRGGGWEVVDAALEASVATLAHDVVRRLVPRRSRDRRRWQ